MVDATAAGAQAGFFQVSNMRIRGMAARNLVSKGVLLEAYVEAGGAEVLAFRTEAAFAEDNVIEFPAAYTIPAGGGGVFW